MKLIDILKEITGAGRTLHIYDFDDTLANTEIPVYVKMKNGHTLKLTSHEFAKHKLEPGDLYDFSEFNKLIKSAVPIEKYVPNRLFQEYRPTDENSDIINVFTDGSTKYVINKGIR